MLERARAEGGCNLTQSELEILGVHHGEVGGLIARQWGLPEVIAEAIAFHHVPDEAPTEGGRESAWFVALADVVTQALESDVLEDFEPSSSVLMRMGLTVSRFRELAKDVSGRLEEVLARYD